MNSAALKEEDLRILLTQREFQTIETQIATAVNQPILDDYLNATIPLMVQELCLAQMTLARASNLATEHTALIVAFGVALIRGENRVPEREEWNPSEGNQQRGTRRGPTIGLSRGFSLTYLAYLFFLLGGRTHELLDYLKVRRIPHAKAFQRRLERYFRDANVA